MDGDGIYVEYTKFQSENMRMRPFQRPRLSWDNNTKMDFEGKIVSEDLEWIHLV
jgi:hypothetical protein